MAGRKSLHALAGMLLVGALLVPSGAFAFTDKVVVCEDFTATW